MNQNNPTVFPKFISKLKKVRDRISASKHAELSLFLVLRNESIPTLWDILVSAKWMGPKKVDAIHQVIGEMQKVLTAAEMKLFSGVFVLDVNHPFVTGITSVIEFDASEVVALQNCNLNGVQVSEGYLLRCVSVNTQKPASNKRSREGGNSPIVARKPPLGAKRGILPLDDGDEDVTPIMPG